MRILRLRYLLRMAKSCSSIIKLINSVSCGNVNSHNLAWYSIATVSLFIVLIPKSNGLRRTKWHTIELISQLLVCSAPRCIWNCCHIVYLEVLQAIGHFEPTFIQALNASYKIVQARLLSWSIKTHSMLGDIKTSCKNIYTDISGEFWYLHIST